LRAIEVARPSYGAIKAVIAHRARTGGCMILGTASHAVVGHLEAAETPRWCDHGVGIEGEAEHRGKPAPCITHRPDRMTHGRGDALDGHHRAASTLSGAGLPDTLPTPSSEEGVIHRLAFDG
jgi:hypothetical protein